MKSIPISKFKAECLKLLEQLDQEGLEVTKHGKPLARILPVVKQSASLIGSMKGKIVKKDKLLSTGVSWHAEKGKC